MRWRCSWLALLPKATRSILSTGPSERDGGGSTRPHESEGVEKKDDDDDDGDGDDDDKDDRWTVEIGSRS